MQALLMARIIKDIIARNATVWSRDRREKERATG
tara:strand:+ start:467 stop:568 length:102 start_codon:yes stop_codon:yes gene_type:complete